MGKDDKKPEAPKSKGLLGWFMGFLAKHPFLANTLFLPFVLLMDLGNVLLRPREVTFKYTALGRFFHKKALQKSAKKRLNKEIAEIKKQGGNDNEIDKYIENYRKQKLSEIKHMPLYDLHRQEAPLIKADKEFTKVSKKVKKLNRKVNRTAGAKTKRGQKKNQRLTESRNVLQTNVIDKYNNNQKKRVTSLAQDIKDGYIKANPDRENVGKFADEFFKDFKGVTKVVVPSTLNVENREVNSEEKNSTQEEKKEEAKGEAKTEAKAEEAKKPAVVSPNPTKISYNGDGPLCYNFKVKEGVDLSHERLTDPQKRALSMMSKEGGITCPKSAFHPSTLKSLEDRGLIEKPKAAGRLKEWTVETTEGFKKETVGATLDQPKVWTFPNGQKMTVDVDGINVSNPRKVEQTKSEQAKATVPARKYNSHLPSSKAVGVKINKNSDKPVELEMLNFVVEKDEKKIAAAKLNPTQLAALERINHDVLSPRAAYDMRTLNALRDKNLIDYETATDEKGNIIRRAYTADSYHQVVESRQEKVYVYGNNYICERKGVIVQINYNKITKCQKVQTVLKDMEKKNGVQPETLTEEVKRSI